MNTRARAFARVATTCAARVATTCAVLLLSACEEALPVLPTPGAPPAAPISAANERTAELDALWRESVQYRSAHLAMAENAAGLARDVDRSARMLDTVEAFRRVPVVADPVADAAAVKAAVSAYAQRLRLSAEVKVDTPPAPPLPGPEVDAGQGLRYELAQAGGFHVVEITLADGLEAGPKFVGDLNALGRLFEPVGAHIGPDGQAILRGHVPYFRDLKPVRFVRQAPGFAGRLATLTAAAAPTTAEQARIDQIQANLQQVEAVSAQIQQAFGHQAVLKISTARFRLFGELVERYNKATWGSALARGL